jgi:hypothetical protein
MTNAYWTTEGGYLGGCDPSLIPANTQHTATTPSGVAFPALNRHLTSCKSHRCALEYPSVILTADRSVTDEAKMQPRIRCLLASAPPETTTPAIGLLRLVRADLAESLTTTSRPTPQDATTVKLAHPSVLHCF